MIQNTVLLLRKKSATVLTESLDFHTLDYGLHQFRKPNYAHAMAVNKHRSLDDAAMSFFGCIRRLALRRRNCASLNLWGWNTQSTR